jgi:hypothetical protein
VAKEKTPKPPIPTGWMERGARLAGQTGLSAARFVGTRFKSFAAPDRANEYLQGFHEQTARQLVEMLGEMKGAAMKVGQLASFYELSDSGELQTYRDALTMLQNSAPPMDGSSSRKVIEEEFDAATEDVFAEFEDEAVASASIGQVHKARLKSGEQVAVKVQYPGVDEAVRADLKNVSALTKLAVAIAPNMDPSDVAREVKERVLEELDYKREASNQMRFHELYKGHPFIVIPRVFPDHCRTRVITQEFIEGDSFLSALEWDKADRDRLGEIVFRFFYGSLNRFRLFSADPHPGNYLLLGKDKVAFLDFGLVRALDPGTHEHLLEIIQALEGLGILTARTPEIDAIWDHLVELNRPVLVDGDFTIDQAVVQKAAAAGFDPRSDAFQALRRLGVPGVMVTFNRMSFGVHSLLGRLEVTNNWQSIARELWEGAAPKTKLGQAEQRWLKKAHPDWEPPLAAL